MFRADVPKGGEDHGNGQWTAQLKKATDKKYSFGATAIAKVRDEEQLSWAKVAQKLDLGSPSAARRAYTALVRPHTESVLAHAGGGRPAGSAKGGVWLPVDLTELTTIAAIRKAIDGQVVRVQPLTKSGKPRQFLAAKVAKFNKAKGEFELTDASGATHVIKASAIDAIRKANGD